MEDSTNIGHRSIGGRTIQCVKAALEATDFRVLLHEDLACKERAYITPWYEHLREAIGAPRMFQWRYSNMPSQYYAELTKDAASILQQAGVVKVRNLAPKSSERESDSMVVPGFHPHGNVCRSDLK